ncbi:MAG: hypothetical protein NVS3B19_03850 [Ginsengibacter sp.]
MNHFRLDIKSNDQTKPVTVKVTDAVGRPLELFSKVQVGSSVSFGHNYASDHTMHGTSWCTIQSGETG